MAWNLQTATITLDDFIASAEASEERLEFVDGQVLAMSGASLEHGLIVSRIATSLSNQLRGRPSGVLSQGTLVRAQAGDDTFLPDVAVFCDQPRRERLRGVDLLLNPLLLVEVLSPSTTNYDHGRKWESYRGIESLQHYLLVAQDKARVEQYTRHGEHFWHYTETLGLDTVVRLEALSVSLTLAEIYEGVLTAGGQPA
ncbi:MAG TPA: Uma2 family endonuclease [Longimicrobium sp.]|nr:Uma2 family endonuclease [Longimicrobium sp.]